MSKWIASLCVAVLMVGGYNLLARADDAAKGESKTIEGELVDMHCCPDGSGKHGDGHAGCAKDCMSKGKGAGVLSDGKVTKIDTDSKALADYAAKTVRVTGMVDAEKMTIMPSKLEVKEGDDWKEVKLEEKKG